jgi:transposase
MEVIPRMNGGRIVVCKSPREIVFLGPRRNPSSPKNRRTAVRTRGPQYSAQRSLYDSNFSVLYRFLGVLTAEMPPGGARPKYSDWVRELIQVQLASGVAPLDIANHFKVSNQWVYDLRRTYECFGTLWPPSIRVRGRPVKIHDQAVKGMRDFLDEYPGAFQDEIAQFLYDEYDIICTQSTVSRCLRKHKITRKRTERMHSARDEELRTWFRARMARYTAN